MSFRVLIVSIAGILKPSLISVGLSLFLAFICIGGAIQSYALIDDIPGVEKPPLYDELKPLCLWVPWVMLALPIHLTGYLLRLGWILSYFPSMGSIAFPIASVAYSYILASWCCYAWRKWVGRRCGTYLVLAGLGASVFLSAPALLTMPLREPIYIVSCTTFLAVIFSVYLVSLYGLAKLLKTLPTQLHGFMAKDRGNVH